MVKISEIGKPWKADLMVDFYFFPRETCYFWAWVGSREWELCPGREPTIKGKRNL